MSNANYFLKAKLAFGLASLAVGVCSLTFAFFGWSQTAAVPFGNTYWVVCVVGSVGAMILGSLLFRESITLRRTMVQHAVKPTLEFLVPELEEQKIQDSS
jgi:multidrug transporter EmrE-like cation transporter